MYEALFQLERPAFAMRPDPDLFYPTPQHREALAAVLYGVLQQKGLTVLCGDAGTGKTTILQSVIRQLQPESLRWSTINNPAVSPQEFLEMILLNFGVEDIPDSKPRRLQRLERFLVQAEGEGRTCVLIIDEGHRLTEELVEEIRLLTNLGPLEVVVAGQPELGALLDRPGMRQVKQRIGVRAALGPLDGPSIREYVAYRWARCGGRQLPFTDAALETVTLLSQGLPRLINSLCDSALLAAFSRGLDTVVPAIVHEAARDLDIVPRAVGAAPGELSAAQPQTAAGGAAAAEPPVGSAGQTGFRWPRSLRVRFRTESVAP